MAWTPNRVPGRRSRPAARSRPGTRRSGSRCGSPASPTSRRRPSEGGVSAVTDADLAVVAEQLGREPRGVMAVAAGPGVDPLGDEALALIAEVWRPDRCTC